VYLNLFRFAMRLVLAAVRTEFLHFQTLGGRLFILRACVVPVLAFLALECDDFSRHFLLPPRYVAPGGSPAAGTNAWPH
jgi:hypothetical protein